MQEKRIIFLKMVSTLTSNYQYKFSNGGMYSHTFCLLLSFPNNFLRLFINTIIVCNLMSVDSQKPAVYFKF